MKTEEITWKDIVAEAIAANGGEAHLKDINAYLDGHPKTATNPTWRDTIRRVVRQYNIFEPVPPERSGVYRLVDIDIAEPQPAHLDTSVPAEITHAVAQGMLVNLGHLYGYETFVPKTDQTKAEFQGRSLADTVSVNDCAEIFINSKNLRKIREIDVLWFAEDDDGLYPVYAFEVEHTTRVRDGLDRLLKIPQRFQSRLFVIGPDVQTETLFADLLNQTPFKDHRERFLYRNYEELEQLHNAAIMHDEHRVHFGIKQRI